MTEERNIFVNKKPVKTLVAIKRMHNDVYCRKISKKVDTTYAHQVKMIDKLEDLGLLETEMKGRKKIVSLTVKGNRYSSIFELLLDEMSIDPKLSYEEE